MSRSNCEDILGTALCLADEPVHCGQHSFSEIATIIIGSFPSRVNVCKVFTLLLTTTGCGTCKSQASSLSLSFFIGTVMMLDSMTFWNPSNCRILCLRDCTRFWETECAVFGHWACEGQERPRLVCGEWEGSWGTAITAHGSHWNHLHFLEIVFQHSGITISGSSHLFKIKVSHATRLIYLSDFDGSKLETQKPKG